MRTWLARRSLLALLVAGAVLGGATGVASAGFNRSATSAGTTVGTKRVFPSTQTVAASFLRDASSAVEVTASEPLSAAGDGRTTTTSAWGTAFAANRWFEVDYTPVLPDGLTTSAVTFDLTFASATTGTTCLWMEVRRRSTGAVLGTHGSAATPLACAGLTQTPLTTPLPEVTTTALADDLRVRLYGRNTGNGAALLDRAVIPGATPHGSFTLLPALTTNAASGTPTTTRWALTATGDGSVYPNASNWPRNTVDTTRYLRVAFPAQVPTGATVTAVTLHHTYRDQGGTSACFIAEIYAGATLIATHGTVAAPSCANGAAYGTTILPLPEVDTPAEANTLGVRFYLWTGSNTRRTQHDEISAAITYHLD